MGLWGDIKHGFSSAWDHTGGAMAKFFAGGWNNNETMFRYNRFPVFYRSWWQHTGRLSKITTWWKALGWFQKICYVLFVVLVGFILFGLIFVGSDFIMDFEDFVLMFESLFSNGYELLQLGLEWTITFAGFFFLTINPIYHILMAVCESLGISPLPMYIIVLQSTSIAFLGLYTLVFKKYISQAGIKYPVISKIYHVLDFPFKIITDTFGAVFGQYAVAFFDLIFFPIRILLIFLDILFDKLKF